MDWAFDFSTVKEPRVYWENVYWSLKYKEITYLDPDFHKEKQDPIEGTIVTISGVDYKLVKI